MYKKHISEIDNSESFFSVDGCFWFTFENPEYEKYLAWLDLGNNPEEL
jgi:hypothetical protein